MALKRINKEILDYGREPPEYWSAGPIDKKDIFAWQANMEGPVLLPHF